SSDIERDENSLSPNVTDSEDRTNKKTNSKKKIKDRATGDGAAAREVNLPSRKAPAVIPTACKAFLRDSWVSVSLPLLILNYYSTFRADVPEVCFNRR
ncbi:MAG: hypothetical protein PHO36_16265, partial [Parabacteroides sp.]|nr:hypothetical protein [Parabacteroides sp.]